MKDVFTAGNRRRLSWLFSRLTLGVVLIALCCAPTVFAQETGTSPTCGPVSGKSKADLAHVLSFCTKGVTDGVAVGAYAMESLLWIKVPKSIADAFLADRLMAEQLMRVWMKGWKQESGLKAVTIYVEWGDVEIARGETTVLSGDKITIKR
jgi:hypothetical protein